MHCPMPLYFVACLAVLFELHMPIMTCRLSLRVPGKIGHATKYNGMYGTFKSLTYHVAYAIAVCGMLCGMSNFY